MTSPVSPVVVRDRLHRVFEATCDASPERCALVCDSGSWSYRDLDARANRLAHRLISAGVRPGDRVGLLVARSASLYIGLLGVLKAGATLVPMDPTSPADRVSGMCADAGIVLVVTETRWLDKVRGVACPSIEIDCGGDERSSATCRVVVNADDARDPLCYVMYTSGSTGTPKGVAVPQSAICNFVAIVPALYGIVESDRVYQGMSLAFDFSIEEIWPAWAVGATVVAGPTDHRRFGEGLTAFLAEQRVSVLVCVPTLLATLEDRLRDLRLLILGGEACPAALVTRWSRAGRRLLNTYGPTEATVTATWGELTPDRPVTIGRAVPTYEVSLRDHDLRLVDAGEAGEICIGGPGVTLGYLNQPALTATKFVANPSGSGRMYRTGDLGRLTDGGEIVYLGRTDRQVKIRGMRVDLEEIESVLLSVDGVVNAVVDAVPADGGPRLVAYFVARADADGPVLTRLLHDELKRRLPTHMVPALVEPLDEIPVFANGKVDRRRLPPSDAAHAKGAGGSMAAPATETEEGVAATWREVLGRDRLSVTDDFFFDLGGHSLLAAIVVSRLRRQPGLDHCALADVYRHPTIRELAAHLDAAAGPGVASARSAPAPRLEPPVYPPARVILCGAVQLGLLVVLLLAIGAPAAWMLASAGWTTTTATGLRLAVALPAAVAGSSILLPVVGTRFLRVHPGTYRMWSVPYVRVWLSRKLLSLAPLTVLSGSPLMNGYLRLLGARIGPRCHLATSHVSLPWLLIAGEGASVGHGAELQSFVIEEGWLHVAPIEIGAGAFVGANSVLLPGCGLGEGAGLAAQSLAPRGQLIPAGQFWSGSPSRCADAWDPLLDRMQTLGSAERDWSTSSYIAAAAGACLLLLLPFACVAPGLLLVGRLTNGSGVAGAIAGVVLAGPLFVAMVCVWVAAGRRIALRRVSTGIHALRSPLGIRKWFADQLLESSLSLTNALYATLYTPAWFRLLGAKVGPRAEVSTVSHVDPSLLNIGAESFLADLASVGPATYHHGAVAFARTRIGRRTFVGNAAFVPAGAELGDNSLVGVCSTSPPNGTADATSWLGSPPIFLPRREESPPFPESLTYRPSRLRIMERYAVEYFRITLPATLFSAVAVLLAVVLIQLDPTPPVAVVLAPALALAGAMFATLVVVAAKWILIGRYRPRVEPLWGRFVRRSELVTGLYENVAVPMLVSWLTGTPLISPVLRLFGVKIGRHVMLDTTYITEFDLVEIGDAAAVGPRTSLQTHLFEDRVMKMSNLAIGAGSTVGTRAVVLYDAEVGPHAILDGLSLLMKGERIEHGHRWQGIPAQAQR